MTTQERLRQLLIQDYNIAPGKLTPSAGLEDLGIDSLGLMELLFKIEDEFHIQAPAHQAALATLQDVVDYVDERVSMESR